MTMENLPARTSGAGPLADYSIGMRVNTREGFPGVITDILEGPADLTTYWVALDNDMGGGTYAEGEIWPLSPQVSAATQAVVEHTALDDYPELGTILSDRLPPPIVSAASMGGDDYASAGGGEGNSRGDAARRLFGQSEATLSEEAVRSLRATADVHGSGGMDAGPWVDPTGARRAPLVRGSQVHPAGSLTPLDGRGALRSASAADIDGEDSLSIESPVRRGEHLDAQGRVSPMLDVSQGEGADEAAARLALYLPIRPKKDQRASTTPLAPNEKQGYDEGFSQGKEGLTREPSLPGDSDYMAGFDIGWAEGIQVNRKPPDAQVENDLDKAQIAGTFPDALGPMRAVVDTSMSDHLRQMEARGAPIELGMPVVHEAGAFLDWISGNPEPSRTNAGDIGRTYSVDWCRFRRDSHCWLSKDLNEEASKQAGYAVWNPQDRGYCFRVKWKDQQKCPVGAPGPHVAGGFTDATVPWEQGGQRGGVPSGMIPDPNNPDPVTGSLTDTVPEVSGIVREYAMTPTGNDFFADEADDISRAYRDMPVLDPQAAGAWAELGALCVQQAAMLGSLYTIIRLDDRDPYATAEEMYADIDRGVYKVTSLHSHHPVWDVDTNVAFRVAHDLTGHTPSRSDFSLKGEVLAYQNQCAQTPEHLWPVLFTEVVAQSAYANVHHLFGEQKVGFLGLTQAQIDAHVGKVMDAPDAAYDALHQSAGLKHGDIGINGVLHTAAFVDGPAEPEYDREFPGSRIYGDANAAVWYSHGCQLDPNGVTIHAVQVEEPYQHQGKASQLMDWIAMKYEGHLLDPGGLTAEGAKFHPAWAKKRGFPFLKHFMPMNDYVLLKPYSELSEDQKKKFRKVSSLQTLAFEVTATWADVRNKAKRIRASGGVRVVAAQDDEVVAHVRGDHGIYETHLRRNPGKRNVAYWHCGCKWAAYAWGRSPAYKRFEGRMCSHALALQYETQARTIFGRPMTLDEKQPAWMEQSHVHRPGDYRRDLKRYTSLEAEAGKFDIIPYLMLKGLHPADEAYDPDSDPEDDLSPVAAMLAEAAGRITLYRGEGSHDYPSLYTDQQAKDAGGWWTVDLEQAKGYAASVPDGKVYVLEIDPKEGQAGGSGINYFVDDPEVRARRRLYTEGMKSEAAYWTESDLIAEWEASPEAQAGMTAEEALYAVYHEQEPDLFPLPRTTASAATFFARVRGIVQRVLLDEDGPKVNGKSVAPFEVLYPKWHPSKGLNPNDNTPFVASLTAAKDETVSPSEHGDPRLQDAGVTVSKTKDGKYYVHTHRARGKYRDSVADIPDSEIEFISSTGAKKTEPKTPEVSGLVLKAADTGRILMLQRCMEDEKDPARGTWEFPGGHHEDGDLTSLHAAIREWQEEVGQPFPEGGYVAHTWTSGNGIYQGHLVVIPEEKDLTLHEGRVMENPDDPDSKWCEQVAWWEVEHAKKNPALREECKASPWKEIAAAGLVGTKVSSLFKHADEDQCPFCSGDSLMDGGIYTCEDGHVWDPGSPIAQAYHGDGPTRGILFGDLPEVSYDHPQFDSFVPVHGSEQPTKEGSKMDANPSEFGSLFDDAMAAGSITAAQGATRDGEWDLDVTGGFSTQHDEPEPALPVTDGADEEATRVAMLLRQGLQRSRPTPVQPQQTLRAEAGFPLCAKGCNYTLSADQPMMNTEGGLAHAQCPTRHPVAASGRPETPEEKGRRLLAYVDASMRGEEVGGPNPFTHLTAGQEDNEMAAAAARFLTTGAAQKTSLKSYDLAERNAIINEGEGTEANNLDRLDIAGTHYEAIEAAQSQRSAVAEDEDLWMLDGDPNDMGDGM